MSGHLKPDPNVQQRLAADPTASVWVAASAGTGKTKVLTDRVLALLLAGSDPARILCLTFTKAAAAEMAIRIGTRLSAWATMSDATLRDELVGLIGDDVDLSILARSNAHGSFSCAFSMRLAACGSRPSTPSVNRC